MKIAFVIPARINSERFPNKIFAKYFNVKIIERVIYNTVETAKMLNIKSGIYVISEEYNAHLDEIVEKFSFDGGVEYLVQKEYVNCGSERVMKLVDYKNPKTPTHLNPYIPKYDFYITIPADEPSVSSSELGISLQRILRWKDKKNIYTLYTEFYNKKDLKDLRSCKIVTNQHNTVLYTSRNIIPWSKNGEIHDIEQYKKHVGIFVFPRHILKKHGWKLWYDLRLNKHNTAYLESLEQNMFLGHKEFQLIGSPIKHKGFGIDTPDQLEKLEKRMSK